MARSHVCIACGHDLTRLHAPPDPHYGLPVVVCPGCGLACVRRPYAGAARWRAARRRWKSAGAGLVRIAALVLLPMAVIAASAGIADGLNSVLYHGPLTDMFSLEPPQQRRLDDWLAVEGTWLLPIWLIGTLCMGAGFGALFPHWRVRWWPLGVLAAAAAVVGLPMLVYSLTDWAYKGGSFSQSLGRVEPESGELRSVWPLAAAALLAWALMPSGQRAGRRSAAGRGLRSRRLTRTRKQRSMR